jgi:hypothetical protein
MFPLCLPFFMSRLLVTPGMIRADEKERLAGNLPVSRDPSTAVKR